MSTAAFAIELSFARPGILIVDDDAMLLEGAREFFAARGYDVDTAQTPEEAEAIIREKGSGGYKVVASDVNFGDLSTQDGEYFVMNNPSLFGKAKRVIFSGGAWLTEQRRKELAIAKVSFVEKSPRLINRLEAITEEEAQKSANDIAAQVKELTERVTGTAVGVKLVPATSAGAREAPANDPEERPQHNHSLEDLMVSRFKRILIKWLETRSNLDKRILACGDDVYTPRQMIVHVENETEVGLEHIRMMLGEFDYFMETGPASP